ncbi:MAG: hypothetical protein P8Q14_06875 [Vicingaceae bacterium]|nr:hypothetical protein [Vicingaceae bacterium]
MAAANKIDQGYKALGQYDYFKAKKCFKKTKLAVTPFSVDHQAGPRKYIFDHLFIPNLDSLRRWRSLIKEWTGTTVYKLKGYI